MKISESTFINLRKRCMVYEFKNKNTVHLNFSIYRITVANLCITTVKNTHPDHSYGTPEIYTTHTHIFPSFWSQFFYISIINVICLLYFPYSFWFKKNRICKSASIKFPIIVVVYIKLRITWVSNHYVVSYEFIFLLINLFFSIIFNLTFLALMHTFSVWIYLTSFT